jgi:hypothetical protein
MRIEKRFGDLKIGEVWYHTENSTAQIKKVEEGSLWNKWNSTCIAAGIIRENYQTSSGIIVSFGDSYFIEPDMIVWVNY